MKDREPYFLVTVLFCLAMLFACQLSLSGKLKADPLHWERQIPQVPANATDFLYQSLSTDFYCVRLYRHQKIVFECNIISTPTPKPHYIRDGER